MATAIPPPSLKHILSIHIKVAVAIPGGLTPLGDRTFFPLLGGSIVSVPPLPPLTLTILPGGFDYATTHASGGYIRLDIHVAAIDPGTATPDNPTPSPVLFKFTNPGFLKLDEKTLPIVLGDKSARSTEFGETDMLESITVNTSSEEWGWLNYRLLIGQCRLLVGESGGLEVIEVRVFEVSSK